METETKLIKIKSVMNILSLSNNIEAKGYTLRSSLLEIHIYIPISTRKPSQDNV